MCIYLNIYSAPSVQTSVVIDQPNIRWSVNKNPLTLNRGARAWELQDEFQILKSLHPETLCHKCIEGSSKLPESHLCPENLNAGFQDQRAIRSEVH